MWTKIFLVITLLISSMVAVASESIEGTYQQRKEIFVATGSRAHCEESGGSWRVSDEACLLEAADEVIIKKMKKDYKMTVTTIGSNYHLCEYSNAAIFDGKQLTSQIMTEEFNPKSGLMEEVTCKIQISIKKNKLSLSTNNHCQSFCGVNAEMNVTDLKKVTQT